MVQELEDPIDLAPSLKAAKAFGNHRRNSTGIPEINGEPVVLCELAVAPASPLHELAVKVPWRAAEPLDDRWCERVDLQERIGDAAPHRRILEVARIAGQHPTRPGRLAEESPPANHAEKLPYAFGAPDRMRHRLTAQSLLHEVFFEI